MPEIRVPRPRRRPTVVVEVDAEGAEDAVREGALEARRRDMALELVMPTREDDPDRELVSAHMRAMDEAVQLARKVAPGLEVTVSTAASND